MAEQKSRLYLDDEIEELENEDNEIIHCQYVAEVFLKGKRYVVFDPIEDIEGLADDEVIILEAVAGKDDEVDFSVVDDEPLLDEIWAEYVKLEDEYAAQHPDECHCEECDCEECNEDECSCEEHKEEACDCKDEKCTCGTKNKK